MAISFPYSCWPHPSPEQLLPSKHPTQRYSYHQNHCTGRDMTDVFTPEKRSFVMARIRSKDTKPEMMIRRGLHALGYRFRLHRKDLPGCPDIVLSRYRTVIFVHGCFWHSHEGCRLAATPHSNEEFWSRKLVGNRQRDARNKGQLEAAGWRILVIWECACKKSRQEELLALIQNFLLDNDQTTYREIGESDFAKEGSPPH